MDWKTGVHARDWDALAKKENLHAMAAELTKLEETVKDVLQEMAYLRRREEEMRDINGEGGCCPELPDEYALMTRTMKYIDDKNNEMH